MKTSRRAFVIGTAWVLATGAVTAACAQTPPDALVIARNIDEVITLDPAENFESIGGETLNNLYTRVFTFASGDFSKTVGGAVYSWEIAKDNRSAALKVRKGLKFPSGRELDASDIAYSLQRAVLLDKTPAFILNQFGWTKDNVTSLVTAPSPDTVKLDLPVSRAPTLILNALTSTVASVVDRQETEAHAVDGDHGSGWLRTHVAGTGPYRLIEWKPKQVISLYANPDFYLGAPNLKKVIVRHVPEVASQALLLRKGDVDIARDLTPDQITDLGGDTHYVTWTTPKQTVFYINLNLANPSLKNPKVREALRWLIDYDAIASTVLKGRVAVHQGFIGKGTFGSLDDTPFRLDVARARQLLADAGVSGTVSINLNYASSPPASIIAAALQASFAQAGVKLDLHPADRKQVLTRYRARNFDATLITWEPDYPDPHSTADYFTRNPDNRPDATDKTLPWRASWNIPELTHETDVAAQEIDTAKREELYKDLQRKLQADSPLIVLFQSTEQTAARAGVSGYDSGPTGDTLSYRLIAKAP